MQNIQMQDKSGNYFLFKKRVQVVDPDLPTYIRIPAAPLSRAWARFIKPLKSPDLEYSRPVYGDVMNLPLEVLGNQYQAVYIDPPLLLPGQDPKPGYITMEQFSKIAIPRLVQSGFIFIWTEKELTGQMLQLMVRWNFRYVENIAWIKKNINNTIHQSPYKYFNKSKSTCLIFRNVLYY
jgi:hypothetical protein